MYDPAAGYSVLFGGMAGESKVGNYQINNCLNDTWTFYDGVWTNLSVPGPPPTCSPSLTYDPQVGGILAYIGFDDWNGWWNQTWIFANGHWSADPVIEPTVNLGSSMVYDPALGTVVLCGAIDRSGAVTSATWTLEGASWIRTLSSTPPDCSEVGHMVYDSADGYPLLVPQASGNSTPINLTWGFVNGTWVRVGQLPYSDFGESWGSLAFDLKDNTTVYFGKETNETFAFNSGEWSGLQLSGPVGRSVSAMAFDSADGYVLMFGGEGPGLEDTITQFNAHVLGDTWILSPPPVDLSISLADEPSAVCSLVAAACGAGATESRVDLQVTALNGTSGGAGSAGSGVGQSESGPYFWVDSPILRFSSWESVVPAQNLSATESCSAPAGEPDPCGLLSVTGVISTPSEILAWAWNGTGGWSSLRVGDQWNVSFNVVALGPPFGSVPVDRCAIPVCLPVEPTNDGSAPSGLAFSPWGNSTSRIDSAPLALLKVLGPPPSSSGPTGTSPPPPPGHGAPLPVPNAPAPIVTPTPIATPPLPSAVGVVSSFSAVAAAAGVIAAGLSRAFLVVRGERVGVAIRVARPPSRRSP